jgi:hypothetical protein
MACSASRRRRHLPRARRAARRSGAELAVLPALDRADLILERPFRGGLHVEIERRVDLEALLVQSRAEFLVELLPNPLDEIRSDLAGFGLASELERIRLGEAGVGVIDGAVPSHELDDQVASLNRALGKATRVVPCRRLRQRGQRRRLSEIQIVNGLGEVTLRRRLYTVGAVAKIDLVQVQLEDLVLRVPRLDGPRDFGLLDLADETRDASPLSRDALGEHVACELHGDRREALLRRSGAQISQCRAGHADPVDARVIVEPLVLGKHERIADDLRDLGDLHEGAALEPDLRDEASVGRIHLRRLPWRIRVEDLDRWATAIAAHERPARVRHAATEGDAERQREQHAANEFRVGLSEATDP